MYLCRTTKIEDFEDVSYDTKFVFHVNKPVFLDGWDDVAHNRTTHDQVQS
jgi:hypothetical protein